MRNNSSPKNMNYEVYKSLWLWHTLYNLYHLEKKNWNRKNHLHYLAYATAKISPQLTGSCKTKCKALGTSSILPNAKFINSSSQEKNGWLCDFKARINILCNIFIETLYNYYYYTHWLHQEPSSYKYFVIWKEHNIEAE